MFEDNDGNLIVDNAGYTDWNSFNPVTYTGTAPYQAGAKIANGWSFTGLTDASKSTTDTGYAGGTKQDNDCPAIIGTSAPNKDDLKRIYLAHKVVSVSGAPHIFLELAWVRIPQNTTSPSAHVGFEFNQGINGPCPAGSDGLLKRTAGDLLIVYDFEGSSTSNPTLTARRWVLSGSCEVAKAPPCWGTATALSATSAEAAVNTTAPASDTAAPTNETLGLNEFGEAGIDLTAAGILSTTGTCTSFGQVEGVSRSSGNSGTAAMEDLVGPGTISISNCGTLIVKKVTDPSPDPTNQSFSFSVDGTPAPPSPTTFPKTFSLLNGQMNSTQVFPGTYSAAESVPANWTLTGATCDNGSGTLTASKISGITVTLGETVTCTFNDRTRGTIVIKKVTDPSPDPSNTSFSFTPTGNIGTTGFSLLNGGSQTYSNVVPGSANSVSETVPTGWDLTSATCDNGNVPATNISVNPGQTVTCTFNDRARGTIVINKVTDPSPDPSNTSFSFTPTGNIGITGFSLANGGSKTYTNVVPGSANSVSETVPTGWDLTTSATCDNLSPVTNISVAAGQTVTCTFNDRARGAIIVKKVTDPSPDPTSTTFNFTAGGGLSPTSFSLMNGGSTTYPNLVPGSGYNVAETVPAGWSLTSATCDNGSPVTNITVGSGQTVTCTFNDKLLHGAIKITKTSIKGPGLSGATFSISGPFGYTNSVISGAGGIVCVDGLIFGSYSVQETAAPLGYHIDDGTVHTVPVNASSTCGDGHEATFSATDTPLSQITISFHSVAPGGTTATIQCNATGGGTLPGGDDLSPLNLPDGSPRTLGDGITSLIPGTYTCKVVVDP
jgi:hypothetical protein